MEGLKETYTRFPVYTVGIYTRNYSLYKKEIHIHEYNELTNDDERIKNG